MPAEKPCKILPATSISILRLEAHTKAPKEKMLKAVQKTSFCPNASIIQLFRSWLATIVAKNEVAAHCAICWPMPKAPIILGIATFTIVADRTIVIDPIKPPMVTSHLYFLP